MLYIQDDYSYKYGLWISHSIINYNPFSERVTSSPFAVSTVKVLTSYELKLLWFPCGLTSKSTYTYLKVWDLFQTSVVLSSSKVASCRLQWIWSHNIHFQYDTEGTERCDGVIYDISYNWIMICTSCVAGLLCTCITSLMHFLLVISCLREIAFTSII